MQSSVTAYLEQQQLQHATLLHQAHHLLREAHQRAAARAGAPIDAAHAAHDGHTAPAGAAHAALTGDQDHLSQVQADLAAGNVAGALDLLDRYWPAGARDEAGARAYVGGVIVASLHAVLVPLTMDRMLHTLQPVRDHGYLAEVITGGHRPRDLLLASASGLDRLAYAPTVHQAVRLSARPLALRCTEDPGDVVS